MWKAVCVAVCVSCVCVWEAQALEGPRYGVKLCGREFIRAVIFTCGGSRWRRSLSDTDLAEEEPLDDRWLADADPLSSSELAQVADATGVELGEKMPGDWWKQQGGVFSRSTRSLITNDILEALRTSDRKGRDVVVGLSNACCKWGCNKSEISSLC